MYIKGFPFPCLTRHLGLSLQVSTFLHFTCLSIKSIRWSAKGMKATRNDVSDEPQMPFRFRVHMIHWWEMFKHVWFSGSLPALRIEEQRGLEKDQVCLLQSFLLSSLIQSVELHSKQKAVYCSAWLGTSTSFCSQAWWSCPQAKVSASSRLYFQKLWWSNHPIPINMVHLKKGRSNVSHGLIFTTSLFPFLLGFLRWNLKLPHIYGYYNLIGSSM